MDIAPGIGISGHSIFLSKSQTLIVSDLHLGYEAEHGNIMLPAFQLKSIRGSLESLIKSLKPKLIVLNGDIKHGFGNLSDDEWRDATNLVDFLHQHAALHIILGNHDAGLLRFAKRTGIPASSHLLREDILICHGDVIPAGKHMRAAKYVIIGHEHPAIGIASAVRQEVFKAFLVGSWRKKMLIAMPSFSTASIGTDLTKTKPQSPFLHSIGDFDAYLVSDKIYNFGKIAGLR